MIPEPGFHVLQGNRLEDLRRLLQHWYAVAPLPPLMQETLVTQSDGVGQWLRMHLAAEEAEGEAEGPTGGFGIAWGPDIDLPARFQWRAYRTVLEPQLGWLPEVSPFDPSRLSWRLFDRLPQWLDAPAFAPLREFLGRGVGRDPLRRWQLSQRLALLFDQYQMHRSDWLQRWAGGDDRLIDNRGRKQALQQDQLWQPALWRQLIEDAPEGVEGLHRGEVHEAFMQVEDLTDEYLDRLPPRITVFGVSALPAQTLAVLAKLARWRQVVLCLLNPCQHYWGDAVDPKGRAMRRPLRTPGTPSDLTQDTVPGHPLLAAWGSQGRDMIRLVDDHDDHQHYAERVRAQGLEIDVFEVPQGAGLLQQIQRDILEGRTAGELADENRQADPAVDESITFHVAHGPVRELEVLHDRLLARFAADEELRPGDVIVLTPDIDASAPAIQAVFGQHAPGSPRHIPFQIADKRLRGNTPLFSALEALLMLPRSRLTASEVLSLLETPAVRARFGFIEQDLTVLRRWIEETGIRWGLDAAHRTAAGVEGTTDEHGWRAGLSRMLFGYAIGATEPDAELVAGIAPYDEVSGLQATLAGQLYRFIETLARHAEILTEPATPEAWLERLQRLISDFLRPASTEEQRLLGRAVEALDAWFEGCEAADCRTELEIEVVRASWLEGLEAGGAPQRFGGGAVTFATLVPMRAVPFKVVCLLGMNDGDFPRRGPRPDFDLMAEKGQARPGDRSRREDDRYLFLEALLAARDALHISWSGRSPKDNSESPPSVLVAQLRDHLARYWRAPPELEAERKRPGDEAPLLRALTTAYPLQPFAPEAFTTPREELPGSVRIAAARRASFASEWAAAHDAARKEGAASLAKREPLSPWIPDTPLTLDHLQRFLRDPAREFYRQRLSTHFTTDLDTLLDEEPFAIKAGLEGWQAQDALLRPIERIADRAADPRTALDVLPLLQARLHREGAYPQGAWGAEVSAEISGTAAETLEAYAALRAQYPERFDRRPQIRETFDGWLELADEIDQLWRAKDSDGAPARITLETSKVRDGGENVQLRIIARHWVRHLALQLWEPGTRTLIVGAGGFVEVLGLQQDDARDHLAKLVGVWQEGMCSPAAMTLDLAFALCGKAAKAGIDLDEVSDLQGLGADGVIQTQFDYARRTGSAFARECATLEDLLAPGRPHTERTLQLLRNVYGPLLSTLLELTASEDQA